MKQDTKAEKLKAPCVSNDDISIRLFENPILEKLTKVHPATPLVIFLPIIGYLMYSSYTAGQLSLAASLGLFLGGLFFWTFFEYALHRFVFHLDPIGPKTEKIHFLFHGIHHDYPRDSWRLVMPPTVGLALAGLLYLLAMAVMPVILVPMFFSGFLIGYLFYDTNHYLMHHKHFNAKWWIAIKRHHLKHHYMASDYGFGVSSPLWDHVFKTHFPKEEATRPTQRMQGQANHPSV